MKKDLFAFKNELVNKYKYDEALAESLTIVAESLEDYFGTNMVYDAISACNYMVSNVSLSKTHELLLANGLNLSDDLKSKKHYYYSEYDLKRKTIKRVIVLPASFNFDNPLSKAHLIENTLKLVFSYIHEFTVSGDILQKREGVMTKLYKIDNYNLNELSSIGYGLEEGIVSYCTQEVIRKYFDDEYDERGIDYQRLTSGYLMDHLNLRDLIIKACLTGDSKELENVFQG